MNPQVKPFLWFLGAVALVALASPAPNLATILVLLIIVGVLLSHYQVYLNFFGLGGQGNA